MGKGYNSENEPVVGGKSFVDEFVGLLQFELFVLFAHFYWGSCIFENGTEQD